MLDFSEHLCNINCKKITLLNENRSMSWHHLASYTTMYLQTLATSHLMRAAFISALILCQNVKDHPNKSSDRFLCLPLSCSAGFIFDLRCALQGEAMIYMEPEKQVMSRSADECVVALCDQW